MGLFDNIICEYPLPGNPQVDEWQTKDTPVQHLDTYVIADDGTLWHDDFDYVDRSDPNAKGFRRAAGCMTRENKRRVRVPDFRGAINFYGIDRAGASWEFSALFDDGKLMNMKQIEPAVSA